MRSFPALVAFLVFAPAVAIAQEAVPECPEGASPILILGTYHMDNPGMDARNVEADDVLSDRRQREIRDVIAALSRFAPTKIAIEAPYRSDAWPRAYEAWRAGERELGRNEIEQIAFRLADALGHDTVHPVDYPMWMNGWTPDEIETAPPVADAGDATEGEPAPPREPTEEERLLRASTVGEYLRHLNAPGPVRERQEEYMRMLRRADGPGIYARADLVTNWYKRNLRIFANLNRVVRRGEDRVLLLIGSGHVWSMRDFADGSQDYCPVEVADYLP